MLRKLIAAACFALLGSLPLNVAHAQSATVVASCGAQSLPTTPIFNSGFYMDATGNLCTNASGGGGGGLSVTDGAAWTAGTSAFTPNGGVFNDSATALTSGHQGTVRLNANREMHVTCDASNTLCTLLSSAVPWLAATAWNTNTYSTGTTNPGNADVHGAPWVDVGAVGATAVGTYGTAPGAVPAVPVNAALSLITLSHPKTTGLANNLSAKGSAGVLTAFNCSAITGGAAGFCIAYDSATTPGTGALTGASVIDFCYFDTTARGCSLSHLFPGAVAFANGIQILVTSASSPYTYTTGTDTAAITADIQ